MSPFAVEVQAGSGSKPRKQIFLRQNPPEKGPQCHRVDGARLPRLDGNMIPDHDNNDPKRLMERLIDAPNRRSNEALFPIDCCRAFMEDIPFPH